MNREVLESQWLQVREILRDKFSNLTEEDIRQINGRYDQLVDKLQQKYGYSREEAEDRIKSWNFDRFTTKAKDPVYREDRIIKEDKSTKMEDNSALKWLLGLGIPLLLLGAYFWSTTADQERNAAKPAAIEQNIAETPADRIISNNIRTALTSSQNMGAAETRNVQITTRNGIVTLSGTVPNSEVRDSIENTAKTLSGVRQVVNNLQIR